MTVSMPPYALANRLTGNSGNNILTGGADHIGVVAQPADHSIHPL